MKIAFTTSGNGMDAPIDERFGRAARFLVYDLDDDTFELFENEQNLNAVQGAGIQSAQTVVRAGAGVLVTGHCGPKAFRVLSSAGVKVYTSHVLSITEVLQQYLMGTLTELSSADVEGHWS